MTSGTMDDEDAGIQCREMDIRRGRMTSGGMDDEEAQKRNRLNVKRNKVNEKRNRLNVKRNKVNEKRNRLSIKGTR